MRLTDFYPRPLRGGRREAFEKLADALRISIHALCEEGDRLAEGDGCRRALFLSTPSARRATKRRALEGAAVLFLSTPSARRATC